MAGKSGWRGWISGNGGGILHDFVVIMRGEWLSAACELSVEPVDLGERAFILPILRFLNKPVNVRLLKGHVHAALRRYLTYKEAPKLVEAHRVQPEEQVRASSVGQRILDGIKTLRGRWFRES